MTAMAVAAGQDDVGIEGWAKTVTKKFVAVETCRLLIVVSASTVPDRGPAGGVDRAE